MNPENWQNGQNLCNALAEGSGIGIGIIVAIMVVIIILPLIYLYWWIVVNSLRKRIMEERAAVLPIQQGGPVVFATQNPPGYGEKY